MTAFVPGATAALTAQSAIAASGGKMTKSAAYAKAQEFEGVLLSLSLKSMFDGVGEDPMTYGGQAGDNWKQLLVDEYGKSFAARGGIGLAQPIADQLLKLQEAGTQ